VPGQFNSTSIEVSPRPPACRGQEEEREKSRKMSGRATNMQMQTAERSDSGHIVRTVRRLVAQYGQLSVNVETISDSTELYAAGLKSFALIQLMLALEAEFDMEFPEHRLNRRSFSDIRTIAECVEELTCIKG
jgi:acyl carrier protein